ncbi:MAG TPA: DHA2 family efflux MFS transporter permease subunit [Isosphaeraceae bacterium]|nr:DHA2 family efflux MFS transporter permease subunit [Isosphaeraceae bacterium]
MSQGAGNDRGGGPRVRTPVNHWIVALTVTLATFMEILDTSIANVALPYIAGGLSVGRSQSTWVLTSYLVANAIVLPLSGWLIGIFGRKRFYMSCVLLFTISSALCGAAPNIEMLILFRVLQGLGGGGLQPSEQGILVDVFPAQQRGMAMAIYGVAVVVAPILGPVLGGYISDNYSWRWIFYINIPIGILSLVLTHFIVQDPPGMAEEVAENRRRGLKIDYIGLGLVALGLGSLEVLYAKGQEWDWFGDPFWRAQPFMVSTVLGLGAFVAWELRHPNPMINLRLLGERNFLACGLIIYVAFAALYGANVDTPQMLQELFGYDAFHAGLILSPTAFVTMATMPVVGFLLGKKVDARLIIPFGLVAVAVGSYWQAHLDLYTSPWMFILPRFVQMFGVGLLFVPLSSSAYIYLPPNQVNNAAGLFNMLRNEGGSLGIAIFAVLSDRRSQFHHLRLAEHVQRPNPALGRWLDSFSQLRMSRGGASGPDSEQQGFGLLSRMVLRQARELAYLDVFWIYCIMALAALPLVFIMKKSVARPGAAVH